MGDVAHRIALVIDRVPDRARLRPFQGNSQQHRRIKGVNGRPTLRAIAGVARGAGLAGDARQQSGEPALSLVVHRSGKPHGRASNVPSGQC